MHQDRRRYFRINDFLDIRYEVLETSGEHYENGLDVLDLMSDQDGTIAELLLEVGETHPSVAKLAHALNQKLERVISQLVTDSRLVDRLANRIKEVSLSACGIGFVHDSPIAVGSHLALELRLGLDKTAIATKGYVVAVDPVDHAYFWRINFFDMPGAHQEWLIQYIVQRQGAQLKSRLKSE